MHACLHGSVAAIDGQNLSGYPRGLIRGKEQGGGGDVIGGGSRSLKRLNSKHHLNEGSLDRSAVCLVNGTNPGAIALQRIPFAP